MSLKPRSVQRAERRHNLAYTKTVSMPVSRNAHQAQLPAMPPVRTMSVTRFGVSAEKVQATMETPSSHHGIVRPDRKKSVELLLARFAAADPTITTESRKPTMMKMSIVLSCIDCVSDRGIRAGSDPGRGSTPRGAAGTEGQTHTHRRGRRKT